MEKNWYSCLLESLEISGTGIVAENLREVLNTAMFQKLPESKELDPNLSGDVNMWFTAVFNPWFTSISGGLTTGNSEAELVSPGYCEQLNKIIIGLYVARAFYAKTADSEFVTALKVLALYKAAVCEEIAKSIVFAFEKAAFQYGNELKGRTIETTIASIYTGSTPERFIWNGNVLVNHVKYQDLKIMGNPTDNQNQVGNCSGSNQYLPWVFCAAFGLIAWASAAKETNQKQQRSTKK